MGSRFVAYVEENREPGVELKGWCLFDVRILWWGCDCNSHFVGSGVVDDVPDSEANLGG